MKHLINDDFDGMWGDETPQPKQKSTATTQEFKIIYGAETRAKISAANKGKTFSAETRAKLSAANKGKTHSAETRAKRRAVYKNRTPEQRAKIRAKMAAVYKNRTPKQLAEISAKMAAAHKNRTPEQRAKINAKISAAKRRHIIERPVMTPYGAYPSITAIAQAANRMNATVKTWIKKYPKHYYYLPKDAS